MTFRSDLYRELIQSIFAYSWNCEKKVSLAFICLLCHIVSANVTFVVPSFQLLIRSFIINLKDQTILTKVMKATSTVGK